MIMTALGNYEGMMRVLIGFEICDLELFEKKNESDNINALFEFEHLKAKIENYQIRDTHILYSMGIDFEHAPAEPIEKMIEYFNTPEKCILHKYYCNNNIMPSWDEWTGQLDRVNEKV